MHSGLRKQPKGYRCTTVFRSNLKGTNAQWFVEVIAKVTDAQGLAKATAIEYECTVVFVF